MMKKDFIEELGFVGFTARIKRIGDKLLYSTIDHYKQLETETGPNWHLVFLLLKENGSMTVTEIASCLQFSHPAVIKIVKGMKMKGYLDTYTDFKDSRKQLLSLSKKAVDALPKLEAEWRRIETVLKELIDEELLSALSRFEQRWNQKKFAERYQEKFKSQ